MWPCGVIVHVSELFMAESKSQTGQLHDLLWTHPAVTTNISEQLVLTHFLHLYMEILEFLCYDDGCHLKKYAQNRQKITPTATKLAQLNIVVDRLHMKDHVDTWCKQNCDASCFRELDNIVSKQSSQ